MKTLRTVLVWALLFTVTAGFDCNGPHVPTPPLPTTDPGGCAVLPASATHSGADTSCASGEVDSEPNGSLFTAVSLGPGACGNGVLQPGRLAATDDADVFSFPSCPLPFLNPGDLTSHATQEPRVSFVGDDDSEICLFVSCDYGPTGLAGCPGEVTAAGTGDPAILRAHLAEGMLGCCRRGSGTLVTSVGCDSLSPSASGFVVVRSIASAPDAGTTICHQDYSVTFSIQPPPM